MDHGLVMFINRRKLSMDLVRTYKTLNRYEAWIRALCLSTQPGISELVRGWNQGGEDVQDILLRHMEEIPEKYLPSVIAFLIRGETPGLSESDIESIKHTAREETINYLEQVLRLEYV